MRHAMSFALLAAVTVVAAASCSSDDDSTAAASRSSQPVETVATSAPVTSSAPTTSSEPTRAAASATSSAPVAPESSTYVSTAFIVPFEVTPPDWWRPNAKPSAERPNFVTWELPQPDPAVRFFVPATVPPAGGGSGTDVPDDYAAYLLSLRDYGASFDDIVETTVAGRPATIVTARTPTTLDGSLGCEGAPGFECWGLLDDLVLRMAVIDAGDHTLLVWRRDTADAPSPDYASFDAMLASLRFRDDVVPTTEPAAATSAAPSGDGNDAGIPDGTYRRVATTADAEALGIDAELIGEVLGPDGETTFTIEVAGDRWTQSAVNDVGYTEVGDRGTFSYDDQGRWVTVSAGGCRGCIGVIEWTYDDGSLTLKLIEGRTAEQLVIIDPIASLVIDGTYEQQ